MFLILHVTLCEQIYGLFLPQKWRSQFCVIIKLDNDCLKKYHLIVI
jgi:hypothetical protein